MKQSDTQTTRRRGWPSCLVDSNKLEGLLTAKGRPMRWLWSGDGPGRIDAKTGMRVEQGKPTSVRTIFKIASRLECDPRQLVSDSDAKMIIETARGHIEIDDREGLWGGNPGRGYLVEDWILGRNPFILDEVGFSPDDHHQVSHDEFIPVDFYNPNERIEILALDWRKAGTIASKSNAYDLTSLSARHARRPNCDLAKQIIRLDNEPLVYVHDDVDAHESVTKQLVELFKLTPNIIGTQRTIPKISEFEEHEKIKSAIKDNLNWLATRNIQILDTSLSTDFVLVLHDDQEVFASYSRPMLILAPTTLVDIEVVYPRLSLCFGLTPQ